MTIGWDGGLAVFFHVSRVGSLGYDNMNRSPKGKFVAAKSPPTLLGPV